MSSILIRSTFTNVANADTNVANAGTNVANADTNVANADTNVANADTNVAKINFGMSYNGIMQASGVCHLGSIPSIPTFQFHMKRLGLVIQRQNTTFTQ